MGRFARVCVEVYLTKPLLSLFKIEGLTTILSLKGCIKSALNVGGTDIQLRRALPFSSNQRRRK
ncbi:unnamed protein product [Linum tenue]|uniref:Uncharacterized protein n=1 Tax=Linum tenue TaxID=586396 RepID=A0AAV0QKX2_9ROSI|nr:unnamed protein product [Linum tenue]